MPGINQEKPAANAAGFSLSEALFDPLSLSGSSSHPALFALAVFLRPFLLLLSFLPALAGAAEDLPFPLPAGLKATPASTAGDSRAVVEFPLDLPDAGRVQTRVQGETASFVVEEGTKRGAALAELTRALETSGWTVLSRPSGKSGGLSAARYSDFAETWLLAAPEGGKVRVTVVSRRIDPKDLKPPDNADMAALSQRLVLALGISGPLVPLSSVRPWEDFPFLGHLPGMALQTDRSETITKPFLAERMQPGGGFVEVSVPGPQFVRIYLRPKPVPPIRLFSSYSRALAAAGWTLVQNDPGDLGRMPYLVMRKQEDREVWLRMDFDPGMIRVVAAEAPAPSH